MNSYNQKEYDKVTDFDIFIQKDKTFGLSSAFLIIFLFFKKSCLKVKLLYKIRKSKK